jgi:hypothetical protein
VANEMPGEEMEISTDFGHQGHIDDIDIDLDFASGQQDEDLELGDYDQAEQFQHFNSDNRDELMAEDDASYGMIDADDITYNEAAVNANDYDIEIGGTDDRSWQDAVTIDQSDFVDKAPETETAVPTGVDIDPVANADELPLQVQPSTDDSASLPSAQQVEQVVEVDLEAVASHDAVTTGEEHGYASGIASLDFGVPSEDAAQAEPVEAYGGEEVEAEEQYVPDLTSEDTKLEETEPYETATEQASEVIVDQSNGTAGDETASEEVQGDEDGPVDEEEEEAAEISYDEQEDLAPQEHAAAEEHAAADEHQDGQEFPEQHEDATETDGEWNSGGVELNTETDELGDNSYEDADEQVEVFKEDQTQDQSDTHDHEGAPDIEAHDTSNEAPNDIEDESDDLASLAAQHEMFVRYGESDYRLFAKSLDDDPSEYFFKDISALELPLSEFLSGIRGVISEEVSPLDELVLHIDGLGLEFAEVRPHPSPSFSTAANSLLEHDYPIPQRTLLRPHPEIVSFLGEE